MRDLDAFRGVSGPEWTPPSRYEWQADAECRNEDPELFFPVGQGAPAIQEIEAAKAVCRRCASTVECLTYALDNDERFGVFGGLTEEERRNLKRRNQRARGNAA